MANCPNCGASHIQLKKETNVSWGRAVAGWALFGVVGGAVGAVTGEDRNVNACLDCGTSWKAADLYSILQVIENLTGAILNLANQRDRLYLNNFISELGSHLESISETEERAENVITIAKNKSNEKAFAGCGYGCLVAVGGCTAVAVAASSTGLFWILVIPPLIGFFWGKQLDIANQENTEKKIEAARLTAENMKREARESLRLKVEEFIKNNPL